MSLLLSSGYPPSWPGRFPARHNPKGASTRIAQGPTVGTSTCLRGTVAAEPGAYPRGPWRLHRVRRHWRALRWRCRDKFRFAHHRGNCRALPRKRIKTLRRADSGSDRQRDRQRRPGIQHAQPRLGFTGDPLRPIEGKYYGYLIHAGSY